MFLSILEMSKMCFNLISFPSSVNLKLGWNMGFSLFSYYFMQMMTGMFLVFFFEVDVDGCLSSKCFLLSEIDFGWVMSYFHMFTPNFIFSSMFFHMFKSFIHPIFSHKLVWISGFIILFLFVIVTFTGYGLVLGSLGFWAMVVVVGIIEFLFGELVSFMIFSEFSFFSDLVLFKMFTYHFLFSLVLSLIIYLHFYFVHLVGSSTGMFNSFMDYFGFYAFFLFKDFLVLILTSSINFVMFNCIEYFFSTDNFLELDLFEVPEEMNSEWYLSVVFILLSGVDDKGLGIFLVGLMFLFLLVCFLSSDILGGLLMEGKIKLFLLGFLFILLTMFTYGSHGGSFYLTSLIIFLCFLIIFMKKFVDFKFLFMNEN